MQKTSLNSLVYRNYLSSSLIPIFTIEVILLLMYFGINFYISKNNQSLLLDEATRNIQEITSREASNINVKLQEISRVATIMQKDHQQFFKRADSCYLANSEPQFGYHDNKAYFKIVNNGGSSLYYSSSTNIGKAEKHKARCSEMLDPLLKSIVETNPAVTQAYLNTWDNMNRLYPFMNDAPAQYGPVLKMKDYNFYYEADAKHNPQRKPVWTTAYLDPAGQGWMISVITPIYNGDFLEGVSGLDITLGAFVQTILDLEFPGNASSLMVDKNGTILAMQSSAEQILNLHELGSHKYIENIKQTINKPKEYNLLKNPNAELSQKLQHFFNSEQHTTSLVIEGVEYLASQEIVAENGWRLFTLVNKSKVFEPITELKALTDRIGYIAIAVLVFFYLLFFVYLLGKTRKLAALISSPIEELSQLTKQLGTGFKFDSLQSVGIKEIDELSINFNKMCVELEKRTLALENAKVDAEAASLAKSQFLSNMTHEFRTPLNIIQGYSQLVQMNDTLDDVDRENLDAIVQASYALLNMIDDILELSNMDLGKIEIRRESFDLSALVNKSFNLIEHKAAEKGIHVVMQTTDRLSGKFIGDSERLGQVLNYLLNNAVKFSSKGDSVTLSVFPQKKQKDDLLVQFSIKDTGIGIAKDKQAELFKPFYQVDAETNRKFGGAGMGLAMARRFVGIMGGDIWLESELDQGSTFHFTLLLQKDKG